MNRLAGSGSPYLRQHAGNPVDWQPWSEEVFRLAKEEDKPVFVSIGYSTCHWCHVMEEESFSDPEVAAAMNEAFICVKVDREERPDVDNLYMTVCQLLTGSGGWPLTIVMTPDREPFFAGTYFPPSESFGRPGLLQIIPEISELWRDDRDKIYESASEISEGLSTFLAPDRAASPHDDLPERTFMLLKEQYDSRYGGFGTAPKFPVFSNLLFLLDYWSRTGDEHAVAMVGQTLKAMRMGGIFDQVGYGLHRYSTDDRWFAPHFEKMLYDQALAIMTYTDAYLATGEDLFRQTAEEIITYVLRDLVSPEGGFYSAQDADSEGVEGRFYTWSMEELERVLDEEEIAVMKETCNATDSGNFLNETGQPSGRNILYLNPDSTDIQFISEMDDRLERIRKKLMAARTGRVRPALDDKIMTDWNGLMIAALAKASAAFGNREYADIAESALERIMKDMVDEKGGLLHLRYSRNETVPAFLEDYAYLLWGLTELYRCSFKTGHIEYALGLASEMTNLFKDRDNGGFFFSREMPGSMALRTKSSFDGPIPSGNSVAAMSLLRLGRLTNRPDLEKEGQAAIMAFASEMAQNPAVSPHMTSAFQRVRNMTAEVIIVGSLEREDTGDLIRALNRTFLPEVSVIHVDPDRPDPLLERFIPYVSDLKTVQGRTAAYVCRDSACQAPVTDAVEMIEVLTGAQPRGT
jgi:uncharacterized protein YyaL (SSP411 family)